MNLVNIGIEEFKKIVYPEYVSIFPKEERKELKVLEDNFNKKITRFIKICENDIFVFARVSSFGMAYAGASGDRTGF